MSPPFAARRLPRGNDSESIVTLSMGDDKDPLKMGHAHRDVSLLVSRVVRVSHRERQGIAKYRRGF